MSAGAALDSHSWQSGLQAAPGVKGTLVLTKCKQHVLTYQSRAIPCQLQS